MSALPLDMDSPIGAVAAVLDEVEGLRRTDARSYLPEWMVRRLRALVDPGPSLRASAAGAGAHLSDITELAGRTVTHVWDGGLRRGEAVILCSDGSYLALDIDDGGDDAYLTACSLYGPERGIASFLMPEQLREAGMLNAETLAKIEREEAEAKLARANSAVIRAERELKEARERLDKLPKPLPVGAPA